LVPLLPVVTEKTVGFLIIAIEPRVCLPRMSQNAQSQDQEFFKIDSSWLGGHVTRAQVLLSS
jgi:hypothetical protein